MAERSNQTESFHTTRRQAVGLLASLVAGMAFGGCAPIRIVLGAPPRYKRNPNLTDETLAAFVATVVPGQSPERDAAAAEVFHDKFYPIEPYRTFLASDLDRRAKSLYRERFRALRPGQRADVVAGALDADRVTRRLYSGAIFLTQIAAYGGIDSDRAGCSLIDFAGGYRLPTREELSYADVVRFRATALTTDGNPS
jgi:hypothetical protein